MKHQILHFFKSNSELIAFLIVVIIGVGIKVWKAMRDNVKLTFKWFIAEGFMSALVAFTSYYIFDKMLHLDKFLVYIICAWLGSMSTIFHQKLEELLGTIFEGLKSWILKQFNKL